MRAIIILFLLSVFSLTAHAADEDTAPLNCVILPDEQVELGSPVPGVIEHIGVRRSDRVRKGQAIARLESSVEQATVTLARARASTDTEIELRRVEYGYDSQHRDRLNALQVRQAVSSQNLDDAERVAEAARLRVRLAQDKRREAVLDERRAAAVLARKTIVSPIDGVVIQLNNRVGEYVETRPVARIARLDPLRVEVIAPLSLFGEVREGMRVAVSPETDTANERIATVRAVDAVADPGSGTFGIRLELPNPELQLPAGIKCSARLLPNLPPAAVEPATAKSVTAKIVEPHTADPGDSSRSATAKRNPPARSASSASPLDTAPDATTPRACVATTMSDTEHHAQRIAGIAQRLGANAEIDAAQSARVFGYLVATLAEPSPARRAELVDRLREAGLSDFAPISRGSNADRIALGTYNGPRSAERRRAALDALGIATEVLPRTRSTKSWRVSIRLPGDVAPDAALAELRRDGGAELTVNAACAPLRTAAR